MQNKGGKLQEGYSAYLIDLFARAVCYILAIYRTIRTLNGEDILQRDIFAGA